MGGVFFAERAIFVEFEPVGSVLLVLVYVVIALFAFGACKSDFRSGSFRRHICLPVYRTLHAAANLL